MAIELLINRFSSGVRRFFSGILLSRISGMGRDLAMAYAFGATPSVAALLIAFRFSNVLRRFFGEGAMQAAFIPHFEALRAKESHRAYDFFRHLSLFLFLSLLALVVILEIGAFIALSFCSISYANRTLIQLSIWLLPSLIFTCLYGVNVAFLQCHHSFFIAHSAPVLCNVIWMMAALGLRTLRPEIAIPFLAKWICLGMAAQWAMTLPMTLKIAKGSFRQWFSTACYRPKKEVIELGRALGLGALGVGAVQINGCLDALFARFADLSGPVYLWYAMRFYQLVFALFGIATTSTLIPSLSRAIKMEDYALGNRLFTFGFRRLSLVMLLSSAALCALRFPLIDLIFGWGSFSHEAVVKTGECLAAYVSGLLPSSLILLDAAIFYARGNFRLPTLLSISFVAVNAALNALFILAFGWGAFSVALTTSLSAWGHALSLRYFLSRQGWRSDMKGRDWLHFILAAVGATLASLGGMYAFSFPSKVLSFSVPAALFIAFLWIYQLSSNHPDLAALFHTYLGLRKRGYNSNSS